MRFITTEQEFLQYREIAIKHIDITKELPEQIFKDFNEFSFVTFDDPRMVDFISRVNKICSIFGEKNFLYFVLEPSPKYYGVDIIKRYKSIIFSIEDNEDVFISALNLPSGSEDPDCIMVNSDKIIVSSLKDNWVVYADRDNDLGICAFPNENNHKIFKDNYGDYLGDAHDAAEYSKIIYEEGSELREKLIRNYSQQRL